MIPWLIAYSFFLIIFISSIRDCTVNFMLGPEYSERSVYIQWWNRNVNYC